MLWISFWIQKLIHNVSFWIQKLMLNVSFWTKKIWIQKLLLWISFWTQKLTKNISFWIQKLTFFVSFISGSRNWHYGSVSGSRNWHYGRGELYVNICHAKYSSCLTNSDQKATINILCKLRCRDIGFPPNCHIPQSWRQNTNKMFGRDTSIIFPSLVIFVRYAQNIWVE